MNGKTVLLPCSLFLPGEHVRHHDNVASANTGRHYPYRQSTGAKQAHRYDQQDDVYPTLALITRQIGKQQLASMSYKSSSHSFRVVHYFTPS
jgi:hypothetical protein